MQQLANYGKSPRYNVIVGNKQQHILLLLFYIWTLNTTLIVYKYLLFYTAILSYSFFISSFVTLYLFFY